MREFRIIEFRIGRLPSGKGLAEIAQGLPGLFMDKSCQTCLWAERGYATEFSRSPPLCGASR